MPETAQGPSASLAPDATNQPGWSAAARIAFRFACVYVLLFTFPGRFRDFPLIGIYEKMWEAIVPWFGERVLGLGKVAVPRHLHSSDTLYHYVQVLCFVITAALLTAVWSLKDRRRTEYAKGLEALRIYLRYIVATAMLNYGAAKVFLQQFAFPGPDRLLQSYGHSSPMGLLWTFMGYSPGYMIFTGGLELLGGFLLFFRRTALLGALLVLGVMANIVMLNFCYDVSVKIVSSHIALMSLCLVVPDLRRVADFFLLGRVAPPLPPPPPFPSWVLRVGRIVKPVYIGLISLLVFGGAASYLFSEGALAPPPPLYGVYEVEQFVRDGQPLLPSLDESRRWRALGIGRNLRVTTVLMNDERLTYRGEDDADKRTLTLTPMGADLDDPNLKTTLSYSQPDADHLKLSGRVEGAPIEVRLRKVDTTRFLLVNRGFHLVTEHTLNR